MFFTSGKYMVFLAVVFFLYWMVAVAPSHAHRARAHRQLLLLRAVELEVFRSHLSHLDHGLLRSRFF